MTTTTTSTSFFSIAKSLLSDCPLADGPQAAVSIAKGTMGFMLADCWKALKTDRNGHAMLSSKPRSVCLDLIAYWMYSLGKPIGLGRRR